MARWQRGWKVHPGGKSIGLGINWVFNPVLRLYADVSYARAKIRDDGPTSSDLTLDQQTTLVGAGFSILVKSWDIEPLIYANNAPPQRPCFQFFSNR